MSLHHKPQKGHKDIYNTVKRLVAEAYDVVSEDLTPETHFGYDLHDDLEIVEVMIGCEEEFGLHITDAEVEQLETVGMLAEYIHQRLNELTTNPTGT